MTVPHDQSGRISFILIGAAVLLAVGAGLFLLPRETSPPPEGTALTDPTPVTETASEATPPAPAAEEASDPILVAERLIGEGKRDEAILVLRQEDERNPTSGTAYLLGAAYLGDGRIDQARPYFAEAWRRVPDSPALSYQVGEALWRTGLWFESVDALDQAAPSFETDGVFQEIYGRALWDAGRADSATAVLAYASTLRPTEEQLQVDLGGMLIHSGRVDDARTVWEEGLTRFPDSYDLNFNVAVALAQEGKLDQAQYHLTKALAVQPDSQDAQRLQTYIRTQR